MGQVKRPYGPFSQTMLESLRSAGLLKVDAFLAWLSERDIDIDRTLVSHWSAGRSHLPADLLPCLAAFTGRPEAVFRPYLEELNCEVVRLPKAPPKSADLLDAVLEVGAAVGRLQDALVDARSPRSPGGAEVTAQEQQHLREHLQEAIERLLALKSGLDATS